MSVFKMLKNPPNQIIDVSHYQVPNRTYLFSEYQLFSSIPYSIFGLEIWKVLFFFVLKGEDCLDGVLMHCTGNFW